MGSEMCIRDRVFTFGITKEFSTNTPGGRSSKNGSTGPENAGRIPAMIIIINWLMGFMSSAERLCSGIRYRERQIDEEVEG